MHVNTSLHVSVPHVEKLAYFLVLLLLPIFPLTSLGTVLQGGLATSAVLELKLRRRFGSAEDAAVGHDCCWSRMGAVTGYRAWQVYLSTYTESTLSSSFLSCCDEHIMMRHS
jgi:hypothetical protein